jgi:hypothetical protein
MLRCTDSWKKPAVHLQQLDKEKTEIEQTLGQAIEENAALESQVATSQKERNDISSQFQVASVSLEE